MTSQRADIEQLFQSAIRHHQAGRFSQAKNMYQEILTLVPGNANVNHMLGVVEHLLGNNEKAAQLISRAIQSNPHELSYYNNLSVVLQEQGLIEKAVENCRKALFIDPDNFETLVNLGNYLKELGRLDEAGGCYNKAISLKPDNAVAHNNLGSALTDLGYLDQAVTSFRKALAIKPGYAEARRNLGNVFLEQGLLSEAINCYQKALALKPGLASAHNNLGNALKDRGCLSEAIACYRKALAIKPDYSLTHSNLIFTLNCLPNSTQDEIYNESLQWENKHGEGFLTDEPVYTNTREPERRLRIGYLSPDFRSHSVAYFFEPVLQTHNKDTVEIFCYANVIKPDFVTGRIQTAADHWLSIVGKNDAEVVELIRQDRIDILVDLAGHSAKNRLLVFARKPAPIQVSWLGYPNTTGLRSIDYRLTDAIADPVGDADRLHSEQLVRLQHGFLCYQPDESAPDVSTPPFVDRGYITFGSFNNLVKVSLEVVQVWSEILRAVPGSLLVLKCKQLTDEETKARYLEMFGKQGIASERIKLSGWLPKKESHLELYNGMDIALDPFPYNGTTTTCEALWMGVPVVTLLGNRHSGRVGASIMNHVDLPELVAGSIENYAEMAIELANDQDRLGTMRSGLRQHMHDSEIMNKQIFTRSLEKTYQQMWIKWCREQV